MNRLIRTLRTRGLTGAVEESTLADRGRGQLLAQDQFVRDNLESSDVLAISIGGNDIALRPSPTTIACMVALLLQPESMIESGSAVGLGHFVQLFKDEVAQYIRSVVAVTKPRLVVACMIYFPDEVPGGSWADRILSMLGYNSNPGKLQKMIRRVYADATAQIGEVDGIKVLPCPFFEILDGKNSADYCARVEPSPVGGQKMARGLVQAVSDELWGGSAK